MHVYLDQRAGMVATEQSAQLKLPNFPDFGYVMCIHKQCSCQQMWFSHTAYAHAK